MESLTIGFKLVLQISDHLRLLRACLSCFGNGNEKAERFVEGFAKNLDVKIILAQFSLIRSALFTRLQKLETVFSKKAQRVFVVRKDSQFINQQ